MAELSKSDSNDDNVKSELAPLMLDRARAGMLNAVFHYADLNPEFQDWLNQRDLQKIMTEFFEDFNKKYHEHKWCSDPFCDYDKRHGK